MSGFYLIHFDENSIHTGRTGVFPAGIDAAYLQIGRSCMKTLLWIILYDIFVSNTVNT
jgi:hypothetical protein